MGLEALALPVIATLALLAVFSLISNRDWRDYRPEVEYSPTGRFLEWYWGSPVAWMLTFVLAIVVVGLTAVLAVSEGSVMAVSSASVLPVALAILIGALSIYFFLGSYYSIRSRGTPSSLAAAITAVVVGFVVLAAVALRLAGVL